MRVPKETKDFLKAIGRMGGRARAKVLTHEQIQRFGAIGGRKSGARKKAAAAERRKKESEKAMEKQP